MLKQPEWIPVEKVIDVVAKATNKNDRQWEWLANSKCKYISVRIDMRDGACVIKDRDGNSINLEELEYQHKAT